MQTKAPHLVCKQTRIVVIQYSPAPAARANRFVWAPAMWYVSYKFHVQTYTNPSRISVIKKCSGVPHAATPVTLTEANPSRYCGRSLIVAMPDLEAGRDPRRRHRKDNAVRRSFCSFQLTSEFQARSNRACCETACYKSRKFSPSYIYLSAVLPRHAFETKHRLGSRPSDEICPRN